MWHYVNKSQSGWILLIVLLFLQIISLLGFYIVQTSLFAHKVSGSQWRKQELFMHAEQLLYDLAENFSVYCIVPQISSNELLMKPLSWWQSTNTCAGSLEHNDYYYIVEFLGEDVCASEMEDQTNVAHYFRITLLMLDKKNDIRERLQITSIKLDNASYACRGPQRHIVAGMQTWYRL